MYQDTVIFKVPASVAVALRELARKHHMSKSEYLRRIAIERLEREGVRLPPPSLSYGGLPAGNRG